MTSPSVGVAVITHCAKQHLQNCLPSLLDSPLKPKVLVVNSSSFDGTVEEAERLGADTLVIPRSAFNHGSTRELARQRLATDIVVMHTPDAYPSGTEMLENLIAPIVEGKASVAYARQLPHHGAGLMEAFPRRFNYPNSSHIRGIGDADRYGVYLFFCSDSCAAYLNSALDEIEGFEAVLTAEDSFAVAKLLRRGHKIAYVADAVVHHSHDYSLLQEFRRHFDTGYVRKLYGDLLNCPTSDHSRGLAYVKALVMGAPWRQKPYCILHCLSKWLGYNVGRASTSAPVAVKRALSGQDYFWKSDDFLSGNAR